MMYRNLLFMTLISFVSMYVLMYVMVDQFGNVYNNLNQFYMAGLMTMPMVIIELLVMQSMYPNKKLNILIAFVSTLLLIVFTVFIRKQIAITDREFLKSMIPHHASAVLMCKEATLKDPAIKNLCQNILASQQAEIDFMKTKLKN